MRQTPNGRKRAGSVDRQSRLHAKAEKHTHAVKSDGRPVRIVPKNCPTAETLAAGVLCEGYDYDLDFVVVGWDINGKPIYEQQQGDARPDKSLTARDWLRHKDFATFETEPRRFWQFDHKLGRMVEGTDERLTWKSDDTLMRKGDPFKQATLDRQTSRSKRIVRNVDGVENGREGVRYVRIGARYVPGIEPNADRRLRVMDRRSRVVPVAVERRKTTRRHSAPILPNRP